MEADESSINDIFEPNCSVITGNQDIQQVPISIFPGLSSYMKNPLFKNQFQHFVNRFSEIDITTTARESGTSLALKSGDTAIKKTNIG